MGYKTLNILLVEDEPAHVELIRRAFQAKGWEAEIGVATTLAEAEQCIVQSPPDILVADLLLPDGKGTDLLPREPADALFPVVVITSFGNEQMAVETIRAGAADYVVKSESAFASMPRLVERVLREWNMRGERKLAEEALQQAHDDLEKCVMQRTVELAQANRELLETNRKLEQEIAERKRIEENLRREQKVLRRLLETHDGKTVRSTEELDEIIAEGELPEDACVDPPTGGAAGEPPVE